jgi:hypothetical protein
MVTLVKSVRVAGIGFRTCLSSGSGLCHPIIRYFSVISIGLQIESLWSEQDLKGVYLEVMRADNKPVNTT